MRVVIVNYSDSKGGASRAAYRQHKALLAAGIDSYMVVIHKATNDDRVICDSNRLSKFRFKARYRLDMLPLRKYPKRNSTLFSTAKYGDPGIINLINNLKPNIVHLHWITGATIKIEDLVKIEAPIFWSLHDEWAYTGGCHVRWNCTRQLENCGFCPALESGRELDLSRHIYERKAKVYNQIGSMHIVGLSHWMAESARGSSLFANKTVIRIPNPIDCSVFKPLDSKEALAQWNLPQDRALILFGAFNISDDIRKGYKELRAALDLLDDIAADLVIFGMDAPAIDPGFKIKAHYMGEIHDDKELAMLYGAATVTVVPSLQENLSNTLMESLACGTPVVGFDTAGNPDLIVHEQTGYLTEAFSPADLAMGIQWVLRHEDLQQLSQNCRDYVLKHFEASVVAKAYIDQYQKAIIRDDAKKKK
jgi:glycosyltransferase involved in cell wall biosynthesis